MRPDFQNAIHFTPRLKFELFLAAQLSGGRPRETTLVNDDQAGVGGKGIEAIRGIRPQFDLRASASIRRAHLFALEVLVEIERVLGITNHDPAALRRLAFRSQHHAGQRHIRVEADDELAVSLHDHDLVAGPGGEIGGNDLESELAALIHRELGGVYDHFGAAVGTLGDGIELLRPVLIDLHVEGFQRRLIGRVLHPQRNLHGVGRLLGKDHFGLFASREGHVAHDPVGRLNLDAGWL